jgi:hypothetical protein
MFALGQMRKSRRPAPLHEGPVRPVACRSSTCRDCDFEDQGAQSGHTAVHRAHASGCKCDGANGCLVPQLLDLNVAFALEAYPHSESALRRKQTKVRTSLNICFGSAQFGLAVAGNKAPLPPRELSVSLMG